MLKAKRIFSTFLIFLLTVVIVSGSEIARGAAAKNGISTMTSQTTLVGTVTASTLNVRTSYSPSTRIIGTLSKGSNAYIIKSNQNWYQITFNKTTGWVYGEYLTNLRSTLAVSSASGSGGTSSSVSSTASGSTSAVSGSTSTASFTGAAPASSSPASSAASTPTSSSSTSGASSSSSAGSSSSGTPAPAPVSALPSKIVAGYYTSWSAYSGYTPAKIKASMLNVIHYAFASVGADDKVAAGDPSVDYTNFTALNTLKRNNPGLKTILSVGGWDGSARFSDMALTDASRKTFAQSCVSFIKQYGFDGIDIDWEYPVSGGSPGRPEDKTNFTLLMQTLRSALNSQAAADGKYYYLTFAGGASNSYINNVQLDKLAAYVDYGMDMTYDLHGPWDAYSDLNAPLYTPVESSPQYKISVDSSLRAWIGAGFPKSKLIMGIPFYGYLYTGVGSVNNGLYQRFSSAKSIGYDTVVSSYLSSTVFGKFYHSTAQVPYLFGNSQFLSYDDPAAIGKKAQYTAANGLRGVSAWELSYDKTAALLGAAYGNLH